MKNTVQVSGLDSTISLTFMDNCEVGQQKKYSYKEKYLV